MARFVIVTDIEEAVLLVGAGLLWYRWDGDDENAEQCYWFDVIGLRGWWRTCSEEMRQSRLAVLVED